MVEQRGLAVAFQMGCVFFLFSFSFSRVSRLQRKQVFDFENKFQWMVVM